MLPIELSLTVPAASANGIATAQTLGAAGPLTLNGSYVTGGVAFMPSGVSRRVLLTFAASEVGHNFTITGTSRAGTAQSEVIAGTGAGTAPSNLDYLTVTSIVSSAATTGNVSAGTNGVASTRWVYISQHMTPTLYDVTAFLVSGAVTATWETTTLDPAGHPYDFPATGPIAVTPIPDANINATALTTAGVRTIGTAPIIAGRITINSGTGVMSAIVLQAGISGGVI